jgi:hypothetical protein
MLRVGGGDRFAGTLASNRINNNSSNNSNNNNNSNSTIFCLEIKRMWNMKCMIIPVATGATGIVTRFKEKSGSHTRKTFSIFTTKYICAWYITHNTESAAV